MGYSGEMDLDCDVDQDHAESRMWLKQETAYRVYCQESTQNSPFYERDPTLLSTKMIINLKEYGIKLHVGGMGASQMEHHSIATEAVYDQRSQL